MRIQVFFYTLILPVFAYGQKMDTIGVARQVDSLIQVSRSLTAAGNYEQALATNAVAEKLVTEKLGLETAAYGSTCFNHGRVLYFQSNYTEAEKWYLTSKAIRERVLGKENAAYVTSLNNLANLYKDRGNYDQSEQLFLEAIAIQHKIPNDKSLERIRPMIMIGMGDLYRLKGNYEKSESIMLEAKDILEKAMAKENPFYIKVLINLANVYREEGEYDKAINLYSEAKALEEKEMGKENPEYALIIGNLANVYYARKDYTGALPLYLEAKTIVEKTSGKEAPDYASCLDNLANVYQDQGDFDQALPLRLEAKSIWEKTVGKENFHYAITLTNLANLYGGKREFTQALPLYIEAKNVREKLVGKEHFSYATSVYNLAICYAAQNSISEAIPYVISSNATFRSLIQKAATYSSEKEILEYRDLFKEKFGTLLHFAQRYHNDLLIAAAYDDALFLNHALLFRTLSLEKDIAQADSNTRAIYAEWKSSHFQLAQLYALPVAERDTTNIARIEEQANSLEKEIARRSANFQAAQQEVRWQQVQQTLKSTEAAIEFIRYQFEIIHPEDSIMYAALVLRPDSPPQIISLFEEKELIPLLRGASGGNNFLKINDLYAKKTTGSKQKSLYELVWQPLENSLKGITTIYCSPSGLLHRINLAAIPNADGKVFGDQRQLVVLGSTRQLVIPNSQTQNAANTAYLVGGVRYDSDSTGIAYANRGSSLRSILSDEALTFQPDSASITRGGVLDYLPATAAEVRQIGQTLNAANITAKIDTGFYATEEAFRQLGVKSPSPRIIHLATHGYFFPDPKGKGEKTNGGDQEQIFKMSEHPMIRSGLILAGAKEAWLTGQHPVGLEDGILTAYEISQMNLSGTELVVLSACETGLGDIVGNEGVYGLQRAFKIAGAKYLMMSLWKVDDRSTQEFMTTFYKHWLTEKQTIPQAFRVTQREMRVKHPSAYDWAGFVLIE